MIYLNSYQGFLCCWENSGPWATRDFNILKLYLFFFIYKVIYRLVLIS